MKRIIVLLLVFASMLRVDAQCPLKNYAFQHGEKLMYDLYQGKDFEYFYNDSIQQYVAQFPSDTFGTAVVLHYLNHPKLEVQPE